MKILEIPLLTDTFVDLRTPLVSVLINRVVGINNQVLSDPDHAAARVEAIAERSESDDVVLVLSAHPYDFLPDPRHPGRKLDHLGRFISLMKRRSDVSFATLRTIRSRWVGISGEVPRRRSLFNVTTSDLRRFRNGVYEALGTARAMFGSGGP